MDMKSAAGPGRTWPGQDLSLRCPSLPGTAQLQPVSERGRRAHLVEGAAVLGETSQLALQVHDAGFPPHHLNPHLVILLLQLADLLPVFVLLDQALGVLALCFVAGMEGL